MDKRSRLIGMGTTMLALVLGMLTGGTASASIAPTVTFDDNQINNDCTLREAIRSINEKKKIDACNWTTGETSVLLSAGTYAISPALGTISITAPYITLLGAGHRVTILDFAGGSQGFKVSSPTGSNAIFTDLTMRNSSGTGVLVTTAATLFMTKVKMTNMGSLFGGNSCLKLTAGRLYFDNSEIADCQATGITLSAGTDATVVQSTIMRSQGERGGAIHNAGTLLLDRSTLGDNTSSVYGAGILNLGNATVYASTIAYNESGTSNYQSGALHNSTGATMTIQYSIVANNINRNFSATANCYQPSLITSNGYNVNGESTSYPCTPAAANDVVGDPKLARDSSDSPMRAGGVGATYVPGSSGVAARKIPLSTGQCSNVDQRGLSRTRASKCDIGAAERLDVLLVTGNPPQPGDYVLNGMLFTLGTNITTVTDSAAIPFHATGKALVVIGESVASANVNTKFRDTQTPVLNLEPQLVDDLRMTAPTSGTDYGTTNGSSVNMTGARGTMVEAPHRLGIIDGTIFSILSTSQAMGWTRSPSGSSPLISAAMSGETSKKVLMKFSAGNPMHNGFVAPGNRTSFFPTDAALQNMGTVGQALLLEVMAVTAGP